MAEKSAFVVLQETLQELGYEPKTHITGRHFLTSGSYLRTKFVLAEINGAYFFASDAHGGAYSSTYTGFYDSIDLPADAGFSMFRKEWFDKVFASGKRKTGADYIDRSLIVKSSGWNPAGVLGKEQVDRFLELGRQIKPLKFVVQNDYIPLVALQDKKVIGLETNRWLYYPKDVRAFIEGAQDLIEGIKKAASPGNP